MSFTYTAENFSGPIDLLLNLIESHKLSISEISLSLVTAEFLEYISRMETFDRMLVTQFLSVASTLVLIKARSLIPAIEVTESEEADIAELELQIKLYQSIKRGGEHIQTLVASGQSVYGRDSDWHEMHTFLPDDRITSEVLLYMVKVYRDRTKREEIPISTVTESIVIMPTVALSEIVERIEKTLLSGGSLRLSDISRSFGGDVRIQKSYTIVSFLALLEMVKNGIVHAVQNSYEGDIEFNPVNSV